MNGHHLLAALVVGLLVALYLVGMLGDLAADAHAKADPFSVAQSRERPQ